MTFTFVTLTTIDLLCTNIGTDFLLPFSFHFIPFSFHFICNVQCVQVAFVLCPNGSKSFYAALTFVFRDYFCREVRQYVHRNLENFHVRKKFGVYDNLTLIQLCVHSGGYIVNIFDMRSRVSMFFLGVHIHTVPKKETLWTIYQKQVLTMEATEAFNHSSVLNKALFCLGEKKQGFVNR